jgi:hypothetical protein
MFPIVLSSIPSRNLNTYFYVSLPNPAASKAAIVRLVAPILVRIRSTCFSTVRGLTSRAKPICRLVEPRASQTSTSRSRAVRHGSPPLRHGLPATLAGRCEEWRFSRDKPFNFAGCGLASLILLACRGAKAPSMRTSTYARPGLKATLESRLGRRSSDFPRPVLPECPRRAFQWFEAVPPK